jgi:hypothetical protein
MVDSTAPASVAAEEESLPTEHGNSQFTRDVAHSTMVNHGNSYTEKIPGLGDEDTAPPDVEDVFGSHHFKTGERQGSAWLCPSRQFFH